MGHEVKSMFGGTKQPSSGVPHSLFGSQVSKKIESGQPIFSNSKIRKRVEVSIDELRKYSQDLGILTKARQQIISTNQEDINLHFVLSWGLVFQEKHKGLLEEFFNLANDPVLLESKSKIGKIVEGLSGFEFKKTKWYQTEESFAERNKAKIREIQSYCRDLEGYDEKIFKLHKTVERINNNLSTLSEEIEPFIITCNFFSEYKQDDFPNELYISRLSSLLSTKAAFAGNKIGANSFLSSLVNLIETINNTIKTEFPLWLSSYINFLTIGGSQDINKLQEQKNKLLEKLII